MTPRRCSPRSHQAASAPLSQLRQLIEIKDTAHYGFITVTTATLKRSLRQARHLLEFAEEVLRRPPPG